MPFTTDYFYEGQTASPCFYRIPKALLQGELSLEAAALYGLMLDRVGLSVQNGWRDPQGRVFIYFAQKDVQRLLRCGHNRATAFMRELEAAGLIERRRQGLGRPAKIYVKNLSPEDGGAAQSARGGRSGAPETGSPDCPLRAANKTEKNNTEMNKTHPILPQPPRRTGERMEQMRRVRETIRQNIDYDDLIWDYPCQKDIFDGYVDLMTEAACSPGESLRICGQDLPVQEVRRRFLSLRQDHITYVYDCLSSGCADIRNIKAYILAALYNAPTTMDQYYTSLGARDAMKPLPRRGEGS